MPSTPLRLAPDLALPLEAVTETFAIVGKRGSGKTSTARVLSEELLGADQPVVVLDPTGVWWGLRSSADGEHAGHQVVILGGEHGDAPLVETAGAAVADVVVEQRVPVVLDFSLLSKSATRRFATDFIERLYHRNRQTLHVVVDEADLFAPQRVPTGGERLLGAMNDLVRRGRVRGLGVTLISQRPAVLNKDVLTQAEVLIALRLTGARDRAAINEWIEAHSGPEEAKTVISTLAGLPVGTAWIWSPGWLEVLAKVAIRAPRTFDSSATPKPGVAVSAPRKMAAIDVAAVTAQIAAFTEEAQASDPVALRRKVRTLTEDLARARRAPARVETTQVEIPVEVRVEVPVLDPADVADLRSIAEQAASWAARVTEAAHALTARLDAAAAAAAAAPRQTTRAQPRPTGASSPPPPATTPQPRPPAGAGTSMSKAERAILSVLAQHGERSTTQVAILTGYSHKSGGYRNALSKLRTAGYIDGRGQVTATPAGLDALGPYDELPTGAALRAWWGQQHLSKAERAALDVLARAYPYPVEVAAIADATGYSATSGGFRNALSRLRSLELASGRGALVMADALAEVPGQQA
ncbi:hypothetical protein CHO01_17290 [Cellulomonas hominis]|uniref:Plasmid stabilization system protein ParE n=1 Tax=Cellulomonas hominis TaxID=156981 RepID=A0A511FBP6_9CELL|nr:DUF87 domain-containing protein [Cellulomonas hominis]MBB5474574.1 plasmid stabilization system protein ParE [Cellulomonas hominis]NKY05584.1 DUF87 domain-containing protein [Cellulomonas hominis]GEL46613.1 hypothetical protein CHO01_17290 [Cellulomonas hominis]